MNKDSSIDWYRFDEEYHNFYWDEFFGSAINNDHIDMDIIYDDEHEYLIGEHKHE